MKREILKNFILESMDDKTDAAFPATLLSTLLAAEKIEKSDLSDPRKLDARFRAGCRLTAKIDGSAELLSYSHVFLRFSGVDGAATVFLNGRCVGNMRSAFRTYTFEIAPFLLTGENLLSISFAPTLPPPAEEPILENRDARFRKPAISYGEGGYPALPDMGLFRPVELIATNAAFITATRVTQKFDGGTAILGVGVDALGSTEDLRAVVSLTSPLGKIYYGGLSGNLSHARGEIVIPDPELWWCAGLGPQNLYRLTVTLYREGVAEDTVERKIGLRAFGLLHEPSFAITLNGARVFTMGAAMPPASLFASENDPARAERLLDTCRKRNFNALYLSGGGYYPDDAFLDLCDRYGIFVITEFARPGSLRLTGGDTPDLRAEISEGLSLLSFHPSLAFVGVTSGADEKNRPFFETVLPALLPDVLPGVPLLDFSAVKPEELLSEETALPSMPPDASSLPEGAENPFSAAFSASLRGNLGALDLLSEMSGEYLYPFDPASFAYLSERLQGDRIEKLVRAARIAHSPMTVLIDRLCDPLPAISSALIDAHGAEKEAMARASAAFSPIAVYASVKGCVVTFTVSNETRRDFVGKLVFTLVSSDNRPIGGDHAVSLNVGASTAQRVHTFDFSPLLAGQSLSDVYVYYRVTNGETTTLTSGTALFVKTKDFSFRDPGITASLTGKDCEYLLTITPSAYARGVFLSFEGVDASLSANGFDLVLNLPVKVSVTTAEPTTTAALKSALRMRSLYDVGRT